MIGEIMHQDAERSGLGLSTQRVQLKTEPAFPFPIANET
jgi:hypothetical protein